MAAIRSRDTRPELFVRQSLHSAGFRYRLHPKGLPGKPDLVFPRRRLAVFVHGCFWHGHVCREARRPNTNLAYWSPKIERNMARDRANANELRRSGWKVVTIRECALTKGVARLTTILRTLRTAT
jgi:DNA mismatch endonuclease (patch repair protein)